MNQVILIGRLTKDPELRYIPGTETAVCTFTLAVKRPFKSDSDFLRIVTYGKLAENCNKFLSKGKQAAVSGRIEIERVPLKTGGNDYYTNIVASNVEFLSPKDNRDIPDGYEECEDETPFG